MSDSLKRMRELPRARPLSSVRELRCWRASSSAVHQKAWRSLSIRPLSDNYRLLLCHDMRGGYTEDALVQSAACFPVFTIHHWQLVDLFVYFSHHRFTIPPPQWTNLAHLHGVQVLGTIIFEEGEGSADLICFLYGMNEVDFNDPALSPDFTSADMLVELALFYNFDGWLYNVEVPLVGGAKQAEHLRLHVAYMHQRLQALRPGALALWYDSVTMQGHLHWQNRLSPLNKPFFDACAGIFTNYTWLEHYPAWSVALANTPDSIATTTITTSTNSHDRARDIWTGIDLFGRNTYGGGGYNAFVALDSIQRNGTSIALFAPGWIYETIDTSNFLINSIEKEDDMCMALCKQFLINEKKLWVGSSHSLLHINSNIAAYAKRHKTPCLPMDEFYDGCCTAMGRSVYIKGVKVKDGDWSTHNAQSILTPLCDPSVELNFKQVFNYGSSLTITPCFLPQKISNLSTKTSMDILLIDTQLTIHNDSILWLFCQFPCSNSPIDKNVLATTTTQSTTTQSTTPSLTLHLYMKDTSYAYCLLSSDTIKSIPTASGWFFIPTTLTNLSGRILSRVTFTVTVPLNNCELQSLLLGEIAIYRTSLHSTDNNNTTLVPLTSIPESPSNTTPSQYCDFQCPIDLCNPLHTTSIWHTQSNSDDRVFVDMSYSPQYRAPILNVDECYVGIVEQWYSGGLYCLQQLSIDTLPAVVSVE